LFSSALVATAEDAQKPKIPLPGQIIVDPNNPAYFVYNRDSDKNGKLDPFFMCAPGDPEGFFFRGQYDPKTGTRVGGDQGSIINAIRQHGGNGLYIMAILSHGGDATKDITEPDHANPFLGGDPTKGLDGRKLDQWQVWLEDMDDAGIVIYLFLYDDAIAVGKNLGWPLVDGELHPGEKAYIVGLVNRFEHHKHLIWSVMEEVEEMGPDYVEHTSKIAAAIRAADDHNHPIATAKLNGYGFKEFKADPNIDQFAMQRNMQEQPENYHQQTLNALKVAEGKYSVNYVECDMDAQYVNKGKRDLLRRINWAVAMGGAYRMVYGTWQQANKHRPGGAPLPELLRDMRHVQTFFESTVFNEMKPNDALALGGSKYVLAKPGEAYIAYTVDKDIALGLKKMSAGKYTFRWFDCVTGRVVEQKDVKVEAGDQQWIKPKGLGDEVALYLHKQ